MAARATHIANIEKRSGKSLAELKKIIEASGLEKHGQIRDMLKRDLGLGHGDANSLVLYAREPLPAADAASAEDLDAIVAGFYSGPKAALRPIHDALMAAISRFGEFEIAPKKTYLSLRRKKQFAMVGPATNTRVEVGLNVKDLKAKGRLVEVAQPAMCRYKARVGSIAEVDTELVDWIRRAFDAAG